MSQNVSWGIRVEPGVEPFPLGGLQFVLSFGKKTGMSKRPASQAFGLGFEKRSMRRGGARKVAHYATRSPVVQTGTMARGVAGFQRTSGFYGRYQGPAAELKFHDVDLDSGAISATGAVTATVNIIPQDVTEKTRVGRKCTIKSIGWRYKLSLPEQDAVATPTASDIVRVIMFLDKQANGATAAVTDLLESADYQSFNNLANKSRFRVLHDAMIPLNYPTLASDNAGVVSSASYQVPGEFFKKCNIPLEFDDSASTGAIGTIRSNNLGVLLISLSAVASFDSKIRLRFSDA